ncbi:MAG: hypothetical protein WBP65_08695 [Candidatus Sulfotelmatobacter sp.]
MRPGSAVQFQTMGIIKVCVGFLAIAAVVVGLFQVVPPVLANYSFQDDLKTVAMMDSANLQKTDEDVRTDVVRKAKEHDLPVEAKQVTVQRLNTPGLTAVYVAAEYSVTVSLPGYSFDMHFNPTSGNKGF